MRDLRAIVFDLDDTLYPVSSLPRAVLAPVIEAVRAANIGAGAVPADRLESALADAARLSFPVVVTTYDLPPRVRDAWHEANRTLEVTAPLTPFPDVVPFLQTTDLRTFLVTTGFRRFQESKIRSLGIRSLFAAVYVDAVDAVDIGTGQGIDRVGGGAAGGARAGAGAGKIGLFQQLLAEWALAPTQVVVVGDSATNELAAGRALEMHTIQLLRPGVIADPAADWRIRSLTELPAVLGVITGARVR